MLTIRKEQMSALAASQFEAWMMRHLDTHFPTHCAALGRGGVRNALLDALAAGRMLGFANAELAQFVDLTFMLGENFHTSQRYPWAKRILNDDAAANPQQRMDWLYGAAIRYLRELAALQAGR